MQFRKQFCAVLLWFGLVTVAQAEPLTFKVISWGYQAGDSQDLTLLSILAVDSTGKEISLRASFTRNFYGFDNTEPQISRITGFPLGSTTNEINVSSNPNVIRDNNGTTQLIRSDRLPNVPPFDPVPVSIGFTGTLTLFDGIISSAIDPGRNQIGTLSFALDPGIGRYTPPSVRQLFLSGTSGTLTINQATPIPEPTTLLLLGGGLAALGLKARRRKR